MDVLLHLKWTVSGYKTDLTRDIVELAEREGDLLSRGRSMSTMQVEIIS